MSARLARNAFTSLRVSARSHAAPNARRHMSTHATPAKKSDLPWIAGSVLVFGPLFLYLLSPSARKSQAAHAVHNDKHEHPGLKKQETHAEIMKDDEGTPADVTSSIQLAEASNVPNDSQTPEKVAEIKADAEKAPVGEAAHGTDPSEVVTEQQSQNLGDKAPDTHDLHDKEPADQTKARQASVQKDEAPAHQKAE